MANFSGTINLMGFKGAQVFTNLDAQRPQMAWVCIPVPFNDIQLSQDGKYANARVFMAETNDRFRQACIQRKQQSGDDMTGYMPPSHQMEVSFSPEFRQRALEAARKRSVQRLVALWRRKIGQAHRQAVRDMLRRQYLEQHPGMLTYKDNPHPAMPKDSESGYTVMTKEQMQRIASRINPDLLAPSPEAVAMVERGDVQIW